MFNFHFRLIQWRSFPKYPRNQINKPALSSNNRRILIADKQSKRGATHYLNFLWHSLNSTNEQLNTIQKTKFVKKVWVVVNCKFSKRAAQKSKRFYWLVTNTPYSASFVWVWLERGVTVQFVYSVIRWQSVGTRTKEFSSPHNGLTYTNVRKKSRSNTMFTFCWRNPRNLLVGEDGCHLMINLFCELWQSLMYFSQGWTRRSCFYE